MKNIIFTIGILFISFQISYLQNDKIKDVEDAKQRLHSKIQQVSHPGLNIQSNIIWGDENNKTLITIQTTLTDSKGKSKQYKYEFYLHFIDTFSIQPFITSKSSSVKIIARNSQPLFKFTESNKISYNTFLLIPVNDMEGFRQVQQTLRYLYYYIPEPKNEFTSKEQAFEWLAGKASHQFVFNGKSYAVQIVPEASNEQFIVHVTESDSKGKSIRRKYDFYLKDFADANILVTIKNNIPGVKFDKNDTKMKVIRYFENDILKSYVSSFILPVSDVKFAFDIREAFTFIKNYKPPVKKEEKPVKVEEEVKPNTEEKKNTKSKSSSKK
ncbi:MAG: hypothetical protein N2167_05520 [Flavobacteriales bacterium]|nr:hypothetical protein [Flavobacteriales bacterium]